MLPEVMAIAGPNGSGKTTVSALTMMRGTYVNADDIKRAISHLRQLRAGAIPHLQKEEGRLLRRPQRVLGLGLHLEAHRRERRKALSQPLRAGRAAAVITTVALTLWPLADPGTISCGIMSRLTVLPSQSCPSSFASPSISPTKRGSKASMTFLILSIRSRGREGLTLMHAAPPIQRGNTATTMVKLP